MGSIHIIFNIYIRDERLSGRCRIGAVGFAETCLRRERKKRRHSSSGSLEFGKRGKD